jgi:hypothetical protein
VVQQRPDDEAAGARLDSRRRAELTDAGGLRDGEQLRDGVEGRPMDFRCLGFKTKRAKKRKGGKVNGERV